MGDTENANVLVIGSGAKGFSGCAKPVDNKAVFTGDDISEVKIFVWDSLESMKPLAKTITIDNSSR